MNRIYGVLVNRRVSPDSVWYRNSDCTANTRQRAYLKPLDVLGEDELGRLAETVIQLMRSSSYWVDYISKYDAVNTYHIPVGVDELTTVNSLNIIDWIMTLPVIKERYDVSDQDTQYDQLIARLFGFFTME